MNTFLREAEQPFVGWGTGNPPLRTAAIGDYRILCLMYCTGESDWQLEEVDFDERVKIQRCIGGFYKMFRASVHYLGKKYFKLEDVIKIFCQKQY